MSDIADTLNRWVTPPNQMEDPDDAIAVKRAVAEIDRLREEKECYKRDLDVERAAWNKQQAEIERLKEEFQSLQDQERDWLRLIDRQADLLRRTVEVIRGKPPELVSWSHADAPEIVQAEIDRLKGLIRNVLDGKWCVTDLQEAIGEMSDE